MGARRDGPDAGADAGDEVRASPLKAFAEGGVPGLMEELEARHGASFEEIVEDPEALRRAEDAVARDPGRLGSARGPGARRIDEAWAIVATQLVPGDDAGLKDVVRALESDEVDFGWDPYDPRDSVSFMPPLAGLAARKIFSVQVPLSQVARARESLYGEPPHGVTYAWATSSAAGADAGRPTGPGIGHGFGQPTAGRPRTTRDGAPLSDNERLAGLTGTGLSAGALIAIVFAVIGGVLAVGVAVLLVLAG